MADDLGREAIPGVAGASGCRHPTPLLTPACRRKRGKARQVDDPLSPVAPVTDPARPFLSPFQAFPAPPLLRQPLPTEAPGRRRPRQLG
jgi:hypothetical protein